jgi:hypothetical protein
MTLPVPEAFSHATSKLPSSLDFEHRIEDNADACRSQERRSKGSGMERCKRSCSWRNKSMLFPYAL